MTQKKIFCEARQLPEKEFDKIPMAELQKMVGWIDSDANGKWDVTMCDGGGFECQSQEMAQVISSCEEVKAILMKLREGLK